MLLGNRGKTWKSLFQSQTPNSTPELELAFTQPTFVGATLKLLMVTSSQGIERWNNMLVGYSLGKKLPYSPERAYMA